MSTHSALQFPTAAIGNPAVYRIYSGRFTDPSAREQSSRTTDRVTLSAEGQQLATRFRVPVAPTVETVDPSKNATSRIALRLATAYLSIYGGSTAARFLALA